MLIGLIPVQVDQMTPSNFMQTKQLNFPLWRLDHSCLVCFKGSINVGLQTESILVSVQVTKYILLQLRSETSLTSGNKEF